MYRIRLHKISWHNITSRLEQWTQDGRFWAVVAMVVLFGLMILAAILAKPGVHWGNRPVYPVYPFFL